MRDALNAGDYNLRWMGAAFLPVEWVRLKLDLEAFDDAQFEPYLQLCRHAGLDFINMAELGDTTAHRRALYELVLARDKTTWVGMATTSLRRAEGYAFSEMTGVLSSYRGRGISLALKLLAIGFARSSDMRWLRTFHHPANASAIAMNRRLGFVDDPQP